MAQKENWKRHPARLKENFEAVKLELTAEEIESITNDNTEYFSVTTSSPTAGTQLAANGGTANLVLVVEVIKTPVADDETANITASVVASPVQ